MHTYDTIRTNIPSYDGQILENQMKYVIVKTKDTYKHYMERNTYEKMTATKLVQKRDKNRVVKLKQTHSSN